MLFCSQSNLGYDSFKKNKNSETFPKCKGFCVAQLVTSGNTAVCAGAELQQQNTGESGLVWSVSII